jgi:hypothetical protein
LGELGHRVVKGHQIKRRAPRRGEIIDRHVDDVPGTLGAPFRAGVVHEDLPHSCRGHGAEMWSTLPTLFRSHQFQVCLVDEGCGLQSMRGGLRLEVSTGHRAQLVVHQRQKLRGCGRIAVVDAL